MWAVVAVLWSLPAIRPAVVHTVTIDDLTVDKDVLRLELRVPVPPPEDLGVTDFTMVAGGEIVPATGATRWLDQEGPVHVRVKGEDPDVTPASIETFFAALGRKNLRVVFGDAAAVDPTAETILLELSPAAPRAVGSLLEQLRARWTVEFPLAAVRDGYVVVARGVRSAPQRYAPQQPPDPPARPTKKSPLVAVAVIGGAIFLIGIIAVLAYQSRARARR